MRLPGSFTTASNVTNPACPGTVPAPWQPDVAAMHNCREVALGLLALWNWRADAQAAPALSRLCRAILGSIGDGARFPGESLGS